MAWWVILILYLYGTILLIPVILGFFHKVEMRWVLLWEAIFLLPIALLVIPLGILALRGFRVDLDRIRGLYLPNMRRR